MRSITEIKDQQKLVKTDSSWPGVAKELFKRGIDSEKVFIATYFRRRFAGILGNCYF
jgi:hypothetical protein